VAGRGIVDEKPIQTDTFTSQLRLPPNTLVERIESATPESADPVALPFTKDTEGQIQFSVPEFLVYRIVRVHFRKTAD
jgi:hypothetical protein